MGKDITEGTLQGTPILRSCKTGKTGLDVFVLSHFVMEVLFSCNIIIMFIILSNRYLIVSLNNLRSFGCYYAFKISTFWKYAKYSCTLGLGEMMPAQLWETTMDPEQRMLKQLAVEDAAEANVVFSSLMGARVSSSCMWNIYTCFTPHQVQEIHFSNRAPFRPTWFFFHSLKVVKLTNKEPSQQE